MAFMRSIKGLIIFMLVTSSVSGQVPKEDSLKTIFQQPKLVIDTLKVQGVSFNLQNDLSKNMPWIIALLIGILTVLINFIIAKINQQTAIKNIDKQIKSTLDISIKQLENNKEIAIKHLENTQKITDKQFRTTLLTSNRQSWVNEVRDVLTKLVTQAKLLNIEFEESAPTSENKKIIHEKFTYQKNKLLILLSHQKKQHIPILDALKDLLEVLDRQLLLSIGKSKNTIDPPLDTIGVFEKCDEIIRLGSELLYQEWSKIQTLE